MAQQGWVPPGRWCTTVAVTALAALLAAPTGARGHTANSGDDPAAADAGIPRAVERVTGEDVRRVSGGLYRVQIPRGTSLVTHGPDTRLAKRRSFAPGLGPESPERPPACASSHYQHVLYARAAGAPDRRARLTPSIQAAIRRMNALLNADSLASGGGTADFKVLCDSSGRIRVDRFVGRSPDFDDIVAGARAAGFRSPDADYTIFVDDDAGGACGISSYSADERLAADNASNSGGDFAVIYRGCWYDETPMHEIGHNQGAVQHGGPNSTGTGGHCYDESDVMCYSPDGGNRHQEGVVSRCADRVYFDCGGDDYFDTAPEPGEYLATHWNLGSPLNRFIAFGPRPAADSRVRRLPRGRARTSRAAAQGGWRTFRIRVPRGKRAFRVVLNGPRCEAGGCETDLDLYVRRGRRPASISYASGTGRTGSDERSRIPRPRRGRWYAGVHTVSGSEGTPFRITASW